MSDTRFKKGDEPWNKDMKGIHLSPNTEFKADGSNAMENSASWKGGVQIMKKDCAYLNTSTGTRIRRPRLIYEREYGDIPEGFVIYHRNGDNKDDHPYNLEAISRGELAIRNKYKADMEKKKYSIAELKKIVYHTSTTRGGGSSVQRAFFLLHKDRKKMQKNKKLSAQRNDFNLNKALLAELGFNGGSDAEIMVANYPEKKIQLIINPKDIDGPRKACKINPNDSTGLNIAMGGLIETFMFQNGFEYSPEKNYFHAELEWEITFQEKEMIALEFGAKEGTLIHEYRD